MSRAKAPAWTPQERAVLADVYPRKGVNGAAEVLADRSWQAIYVMASKMGLRSPVVADAPRTKLQGAKLAEAVRLREVESWSFARIGATFGVSESGACNAVMIELCRKSGHRPAGRDSHGRLLPEDLERLRLMLRKGLKGIEIQLRMGISASRIAEERRRYNRDLKERGKALLPPPGGGEAYSGVKIGKAQRLEIEALYMQGLGAKKVHERTGVSHTTIVRVRARLVKRLAKKGEVLRGCDANGIRRAQAESVRHIPAAAIEALRVRILAREPVRRAANALGIGLCSAYRIRDALAAELAVRGEILPKPVLPGRVKAGAHSAWLPPELISRHRQLVDEIGLDAASDQIKREIAQSKAVERGRRKTFEEQLEAVRNGAALVPTFTPRLPSAPDFLGEMSRGVGA